MYVPIFSMKLFFKKYLNIKFENYNKNKTTYIKKKINTL